MFICKAKCYNKLIKYKRASENFCEAKRELEEVYTSAGGYRTKRLRGQEGESDEEFLIREKVPKVLQFSATTSASSLGVATTSSSNEEIGQTIVEHSALVDPFIPPRSRVNKAASQGSSHLQPLHHI